MLSIKRKYGKISTEVMHMKILHTSDWHLGISLHKQSLIDDQRFFIEQLENIIVKEEVDVVVISGDVYDTSLASQEAIQLFNDAMHMLCMQLHKQVIVIAGNHDSHTRLTTCNSLLERSGLHIYGQCTSRITPLSIDDVDFFPIAYFHRDQIARIYQCPCASYEQAMQVIMDDIRQQKQEHKQVVLAHLFVSGATLCESDRFAMVGGSDMVSVDVFKDMDYVALGHLHGPQALRHHVYYSGSPLAYSFSEKNQQKQVLILDTASMTSSSHSIQPLHKLTTIKGSFDEIETWMKQHHERADYLRFDIIDRSISYEILAYMREQFPNLLQLRGKPIDDIGEKKQLAVEKLEQLNDTDIVKQFFLDYFDKEVSEEELAWFHEANTQAGEMQ